MAPEISKRTAPEAALGKQDRSALRPFGNEACQDFMQFLMAEAQKNIGDPSAIYNKMTDKFMRKHPELNKKNVKRTLFKTQIEKLEKEGHLEPAPLPGRSKKVTDLEVAMCVAAFKRGQGNTRRTWYGYTSLAHAARECATIVQVLEKADVTQKTLWSRMVTEQVSQTGKGFNKITVRVKHFLSAKVKRKRLEAAKDWITWDAKKLERVIWIDEKQEYIGVSSYRCYAPDGQDSYSIVAHEKLSQAKKVKYIAAVNAHLGPVYFELVSGTSEWKSNFKART